MTAPSLEALAEAALRLLARSGGVPPTWRAQLTGRDGVTLEITCTGPDLPRRVPRAIATPAEIAAERPWLGTYRLVVTAPLIVFDLFWRPDAPLRIMTFSRGDWEAELLALSEVA